MEIYTKHRLFKKGALGKQGRQKQGHSRTH